MKVFTDLISGDEVSSDAFPMTEVDDIVYEFDAKKIVIGSVNVDTGANASAEEAEEALEDGAEAVINVVHSHRLQPTSFDKKSYTTHIKGYMKNLLKKLEETNPERVAIFQKQGAAFVKKILGNFKDYEFYTGESMDVDGMVVLLNYREDGVTPYFIVWKDGVKETKY